MTLDAKDPLAGEFLSLVNDTKLSPADRANNMIGLFAKAQKSFEEKGAQLWVKTNDDWQKNLITQHTEAGLEQKLGRLGGIVDAYVDQANKHFKANNPTATALPEFGKDLRAAMDLTGAGNHPAIVNFLFWVTDQLGEGRPLGGSPPAGEKSRAEKLFG